MDITQTYDGVGLPAKRVQISRLPGIFDEFGNQSEPIEDTQTTYYVRSTVIGATVAEFGLGDAIHVYAGGLRIARDAWNNVTFEHRNPLTGSWVTSHGHSSHRTTSRLERDPRGAETPLSNPYSFAQSYVDWRFSQPLFIEGGDPFDYSSGREIDGVPVSEAEFQRRLGSGSTTLQKTDARGNVSVANNIFNFGTSVWIDDWTVTHSVSNTEFSLEDAQDGTARMTDRTQVPTVTINATNAGYFITAADGLKPGNSLLQRSTIAQKKKESDDCLYFVGALKSAAELAETDAEFIRMIWNRFQDRDDTTHAAHGFKPDFVDTHGDSPNQVRHATGAIVFGYATGTAASILSPEKWPASLGHAINGFDERERTYKTYVIPVHPYIIRAQLPPNQSQQADMNLNSVAVPIGFWLGTGTITRASVSQMVKDRICK